MGGGDEYEYESVGGEEKGRAVDRSMEAGGDVLLLNGLRRCRPRPRRKAEVYYFFFRICFVYHMISSQKAQGVDIYNTKIPSYIYIYINIYNKHDSSKRSFNHQPKLFM